MWQGKWIWLIEDQRKNSNGKTAENKDTNKANYQWLNTKMLARKVFYLEQIPQKATVKITADTRYRLYINGRWVNDGPARSFPWRYSYDLINVARYLKKGKNIIAVEVWHWAEGTFQSIPVRPGLLMELLKEPSSEERAIVATDESWKVLIDPRWDRFSPRIGPQLPFVEYIDARKLQDNWLEEDFDDTNWQNAAIIASPEDGPWKNLQARPIKLLATEKRYPKRILWVHSVKSPILVETVNIKRSFLPEKIEAGRRNYSNCILITAIVSPCNQYAELLPDPSGPKKVIKSASINGEDITKLYEEQKKISVSLKEGKNLLIWHIEGESYHDEPSLIIDAEYPIRLENPIGSGKWAKAGPLDNKEREKENILKDILKAKNIEDILTFKELFSTLPEHCIVSSDIISKIANSKLSSESPKLKSLENMLYNNDELAEIPPQDDTIQILLDFGKELNAYIEFELYAEEESILELCFIEHIEKSRIKWTNSRSAVRYITSKGYQQFTSFRHFGFRYLILNISNAKGLLRFRNIRAKFVHYPVEERGFLKTDDLLINKIWKVSSYTLLCCMEDTPTDCPGREQVYWVGDARIEALANYYAFGSYDLFKRATELVCYSLKQLPLPNSHVPSSHLLIIPAWCFLWVQMCWEYYIHTADLKTIKNIYPHIKKMLIRCRKDFTDKKTGLFSIDTFNFFDWADMDTDAKITAANNALLVSAYICAAKMAKVLNNKKDLGEWQNQIIHYKTAINKHLWDEQKKAYIDCIKDDGTKSKKISEQTNTLIALYDIAPKDRLEKIKPILLGKKEGIVKHSTPFSIAFQLECLAKLKEFTLAVKIIKEKWAEMLSADTTTFWEHLSRNIPSLSYCHGWSAMPTYFLSRYILGVRASVPGFKKVLIAPNTVGLKYAEGTVPTPFGTIYVNWQISEKGRFKITVKTPPAVEYRLIRPR